MRPDEVLQAFLDEIGRATMRGDWQAYRSGICLPFGLRTNTADLVIATEDELRLGFDQFVGMLRALQVTDYVRLARAAREAGPGALEGEYDSHLIAGGQRVVPPYRSSITLVRRGERWCAVRIATDLVNARWPIAIPTPAPDRAGDS